MIAGRNRGIARLGVLVPFTNVNLEPDLALLAPPGVSIHVARMGGYDADAIPDGAQMGGLGAAPLDPPLALLLGTQPDIVLYGCTSATLAHGPAFDAQLARTVEARASAKAITAAGSLVQALADLSLKRIAFASPYVSSLNDQAIGFLEQSGFTIVSRADWPKMLSNAEQSAITPDEVIALAKRADHGEAEAVVLSCTDMRSVEIVEELEMLLGKPVITSNQAMVYAALKILGLTPARFPCGRLLRSLDKVMS